MLIFSPSAPGCGQITGAFHTTTGDMLALTSKFEFLDHSAGRSVGGGHILRFRLALYCRGQRRPFTWFDDLNLPINTVAFHPTKPIVAIGAGIHDGGYNFNGDLILWNWVENLAIRPFGRVPTVIQLAFNSEEGLDLILRPWNEDWGQGDDEGFVYPVTLQAHELERQRAEVSLDPNIYQELSDPEAYEPDYVEARLLAVEFFGVEPLVPSRPVFSVAWFDKDTVGWVTGSNLIDLYNVRTGITRTLDAKSHGYGVAIVTADRPLVQTIQSWVDPNGRYELQTRLVALNGEALEEVICRPYTYGIAGASDGSIVARQVSHSDQPQLDFVMGLAGQFHDADFGIYRAYYHYLGVQGAPDLYILQPESGETVDCLEICRVLPTGQVAPLWPQQSDALATARPGDYCATYVADELGASLVVAERYFSGPTADRGFLYRRLLDGPELWRLPIDASASAILWVTNFEIVVAAFLSGRLLLIDATAGRLVLDGRAVVDGVPTVIYAMAAYPDGRVAFGSMDGQVLMKHIGDLVENEGCVELA